MEQGGVPVGDCAGAVLLNCVGTAALVLVACPGGVLNDCAARGLPLPHDMASTDTATSAVTGTAHRRIVLASNDV